VMVINLCCIPWMNCCLVIVCGCEKETVCVTVASMATTDSFRRVCFDTVKCVLYADLPLVVILWHSVVLILLRRHLQVCVVDSVSARALIRFCYLLCRLCYQCAAISVTLIPDFRYERPKY